MSLEELKQKKILVLGFGKEGKDSYLALRKLFPKKILAIADKLEFKKLPEKTQKLLKFDKKLKLYFGKDYLKSLKNYDLIIKTPGIPFKIIKPFLKKGTKVTSQTEIFFENCPGIIVGITGTKGKGTTCCLIYQILKRGGLKAHLIGNIGKPVFQALLKAKKNDIFVYELSSHQLQNLKKSPQVAVFLNLWPAHLDYYKNFQEYKKAKENITRYQRENNFFIYNAQQKELKEIAKISKAKKIPLKNYSQILKKIGIKKLLLKGKVNLLNIAAAIKVGEIFKIPEEKIKKAIEEFKPLPHRLEFVGKYKGIEFYNDSLATVPQATEFALESLGNRVKTLILGGFDRGGIDFSFLAKKILKSDIKTLIFLSPGTGEKIWQKIIDLKKKNLPKAFFVSSMREAVKEAYQQTKRGEICLLSPASPSFNLFRDYRERGNLFKKFVKYYGSKSK
ncbi:MAG: UDP-N-acetylmuramoyl-L-alanine--D-glutamate ligase [Candidatus Nealsonbacteria bacterium]|nr:MAG: UDP-N-acetylmuramoyl-L-alanine--D-glutamate ligase [Candidatus Nealsonbacteria bacterium]